ncbi:hypothetical protein CEXT_583341 [Caerostris extrusa]|uniref:Uncharacterized protein n=1 Tax=Caerostris extrusa TaxID=172846 RepID=A0AAV4UYA5_CAEEX|nr:hypothetical protein CEXT_583341 [Caerostris extrusa]
MPNTSKRTLMNGSPVTQTDPILPSATHSSLPPPHSNRGIGLNEKAQERYIMSSPPSVLSALSRQTLTSDSLSANQPLRPSAKD